MKQVSLVFARLALYIGFNLRTVVYRVTSAPLNPSFTGGSEAFLRLKSAFQTHKFFTVSLIDTVAGGGHWGEGQWLVGEPRAVLALLMLGGVGFGDAMGWGRPQGKFAISVIELAPRNFEVGVRCCQHRSCGQCVLE